MQDYPLLLCILTKMAVLKWERYCVCERVNNTAIILSVSIYVLSFIWVSSETLLICACINKWVNDFSFAVWWTIVDQIYLFRCIIFYSFSYNSSPYYCQWFMLKRLKPVWWKILVCGEIAAWIMFLFPLCCIQSYSISHFSNSLQVFWVFCNISELILKMMNGIRVLEKSWAWLVFW